MELPRFIPHFFVLFYIQPVEKCGELKSLHSIYSMLFWLVSRNVVPYLFVSVFCYGPTELGSVDL